jgi:hypothetical protein
MTRSRSPRHSQLRTPVVVVRTLGRNHDHCVHRRATAGFLLIVLFSMLAPSFAVAEGKVSPILLADVVSRHPDQLAPIDSDEGALKLFTTTVGPALGLKDAAGALGARRLPSKMVKELGLADLSQSVSELMAALAVWQFADSISHDDTRSTSGTSLPTTKQDWIKSRSKVESLSDLFRVVPDNQRTGTSHATASPKNTELLLAANRTALEASQKATAAWWDIYGWRERIRQAKGQARLCGTWQWTIHNHQIHGEQKATIIFPPPGQKSPDAATPAEIIILGDAIYLRWEQNGHIQEDSLLFIKDDAKIEGSFENNTGGWGPISGKRTAPCQP